MSAAQSGMCVVHASAHLCGPVSGQRVWSFVPGPFLKDCGGKHETKEDEIGLLEPRSRLLKNDADAPDSGVVIDPVVQLNVNGIPNPL